MWCCSTRMYFIFWSCNELRILRLWYLSGRLDTDNNVCYNTWTATEIASAIILGLLPPSSIHHIKLVMMSKWISNYYLLLDGSQILIDLIMGEQVTTIWDKKSSYKTNRKCVMELAQIHLSLVIKYACVKDFNIIVLFDNYHYFFIL